MILHMKPKATEKDIEKVIDKIKELGYETDISRGIESTIIGIKGDARKLDENLFLEIPVVEKVFRVSKKWKEVSREFHPDNTVVDVNGKVKIGEGFTIIAGPCAIESRDQLFRTAEIVKKAGADILRGGAFKPRTSSYDFQGLGPKGIEYLAQAREEFEIPVVTELLDRTDIELFKAYEIGKRVGLNYIYCGNIANKDHSNTTCPTCKKLIIERDEPARRRGGIWKTKSCFKGICPKCKSRIYGIWTI